MSKSHNYLILVLAISFASTNTYSLCFDSIVKDTLSGTGLFSIENDNYYDDMEPLYSRTDMKSYISIKGQISNFPIPRNIDSIRYQNRFGGIQVYQINGSPFHRFPPRGDLIINSDGTVSYEIKIHDLSIKNSDFNHLTDTLKLVCTYTYSSDTTSCPLRLTVSPNPNEKVIYSRLVNGTIEQELGLNINENAIKGLVIFHHPYYNSKTPNKLTHFSQVETLYIRGFMTDLPFPEEVFSLPKLRHITFDLSNANPDGSPKKSSEIKFFLPQELFQMETIESILIEHCRELNLPKVPPHCNLKSFNIYGACKIDSIPGSFSNLTHLRTLRIPHNQIQAPLPDDLHQLTLLDTIVLNIPNGHIPVNFGPWKEASYVKLRQTNNSNISDAAFEELKTANLPALISAFPNADFIEIDQKKY